MALQRNIRSSVESYTHNLLARIQVVTNRDVLFRSHILAVTCTFLKFVLCHPAVRALMSIAKAARNGQALYKKILQISFRHTVFTLLGVLSFI